MNSRRFIPLDVRPVVLEQAKVVVPVVIEQPKALASDDVENITDDEEDEWKRKPNQQQNLIVVKKPQIIVVKKQPVVKQNGIDPIIIPAELDALIDDIVAFHEIEKRRKQRQRIKRKKANKRRYQKMLWAKRYKHKKITSFY